MNTKSLLFVWRDEVTSLYFHVGTLTYNGRIYTFEYTHHSQADRKVKDAIDHGYELHPAFPQLTKKYESIKLFSAFARRIPSKSRMDYDEVLKKLSLPEDADQMDILRATRGMIGNNPYFFDEPLRLVEGNILTNHFYISGMRHRGLSMNWDRSIQIGDELVLKPDLGNPVDSNAVKILTQDQIWLGFVPGIFSKAIRALLEREVKMKVVIDEINAAHAPQWWVRVSFQSILDQEQSTELSQSGIKELEGLIIHAA